jgi:hypothetical protein
VTGLLATVASRMFLRETWRQHRGAKTTRLRRPLSQPFVFSAAKTSTASRPTFVTMANAPLSGETGEAVELICPTG